MVFGAAMVATGALCLVLGLDRTAYRFAGITLTIVMLIQRNRPPWIIATHRCIEVSLGIAVAPVFTAVWPEKDPATVSG